jgi:predicted amidophosphoribosyltransferase
MPFCPKCRDEFQDWVKVCPDCRVELVATLPELTPKPKKTFKNKFLVTVATFNYPLEAHLSRAKLESEGIKAFVADEHMINANWLYSIAVYFGVF